jgi:hypothetical protein
MEYCGRTIRRKVKKAVNTIMAELETTANNASAAQVTSTVMNIEMFPDSFANNVSETCESDKNINANSDLFITPSVPNAADSHRVCDYETDSDKSDTESEGTEFATDTSEYDSEDDVKSKLCDWATSFNISQAAITALLHILWLAGLDLPKDARTLLQTPDGDAQIKQIPGGNYYHFVNQCVLVMFCRSRISAI